MSQPEPLYKLVEQFRAWAASNMRGFTEQALAVQNRDDELEAALRAWNEHFSKEFNGLTELRARLLGLPAKEPAEKP